MFSKKKNYKYLKLSKPKSKIFTYKKEVFGILLFALSILLALSLFSYSPIDKSWFYFTSQAKPYANWCGWFGANFSAISLYLFGSAAYVFLIFLIFSSFLFFLRRSFKAERDRLFTFVILLFSSAALLKAFELDFTKSFPGGRVGEWTFGFVRSYLGPIGTKVLLVTIILICLIILFRVSIFKVLRIVSQFLLKMLRIAGRYLLHLLIFVGKKLWELFLSMCKTLWEKIKQFFRWLFHRKKKSGGGSGEEEKLIYFEKKENTAHPEQDNESKGSIERQEQDEDVFKALEDFINESDDRTHSTPLTLRSGRAGDDFKKEDNESVRPDQPEERSISKGFIDRFQDKQIHTTLYAKPLGAFKLRFLPNTIFSTNILDQSRHPELVSGSISHKNVQPKIEYSLPDLRMFRAASSQDIDKKKLEQECKFRAEKLEEKLSHFGIKGSVVAVRPGPVITLFEYKPEIDSKISKIMSLEDDLALALKAVSIRIIAPIPGRSVVGFEIANNLRQSVFLSDIVNCDEFETFDGNLPLVFGVDIVGRPIVTDLVKMPHLLVAGATGSGKSVGLNAMLVSMLCKLKPDELKLILIDPKRLEFAPYADIPHLLFPIVTNPRTAAPVLKWLVQEMERRYDKMAEAGVRNIIEYRELMKDGCSAQEDSSIRFASQNTQGERTLEREMPFIVLMIDELADLMMVAGKDVEMQIARIAQMARAAGIHMIVATQRPSVDVLTGLIKVNFPSRVAFRVSSKIDSRTIVDCAGAEKLLGRGDMLYMNSISSDLMRIHGAYVSHNDIEKLTMHLRAQQEPQYLDLQEELQSLNQKEVEELEDELYPEILEFVKTKDEISISMLQRQYRIGFNRSARIIEKLEMDGILAPAQGSKPRRVLHD
jgi:DNA segregation ATPase FtsK/SpoIIIE-like protein